MVYIHSMYGVPVMERFRILQGKIVLQGVFTRHPAVVEYYGKEGWESLSALHRDLGPTVDVIRGNRGGQGFRLGDGTVLLEELGEIGDRIRIQVREMPFWRHLLSLLGSS